MSKNIVEELPARKHSPAPTPTAKAEGGDSGKPAAKPAAKPEAKKGGSEGGGSVEEGSAKRIRQAVYDIRYRARREDIDLKAAFSQYMSNSSLSQQERTEVRGKLFGKEGGGVSEKYIVGADEWASDNLANALYKVFVENSEVGPLELAYLMQLDEDEKTKYKIRVIPIDGATYVRYGDREKITQLRQNPNIKSVEMTEYGDPYEGERKQGTQTARATGGGAPKAKKDFDGDGKTETPAKEHAGSVHNAIQKKKGGTPDGNDTRKDVQASVQYAYGKTFLADGTVSTEGKNKKKITGENVDNYKTGAVKIAPDNKTDDPSVTSSRGGIYSSFAHQTLLSTLAEKVACDKKKKEKEAYLESKINTPDCEKKPKEKEKDMRGTYAKLNLVKNKIRSMGVKDPCVSIGEIGEENISEEGYDRMRDDRLVKYGIGHDGSDRRAPSRSSGKPGKKIKGKTVLQKETEKKYGKGKTALEIVKQQIEDRDGEGAIMTAKKKKKKGN